MVVRLAPKRHKSAMKFLRYHLDEVKQNTGADRFQLLNPNGSVLFEGNKKEILAFVKRVNGPRKSQRDGMAGIASLPAVATYALKAKGLLATAKDGQDLHRPAFEAAMRTFAKRAVAQTTRKDQATGKLVREYVRVVPVAVVAPANNNRAGEAEVSRDFFILKKGWDPVGKRWRSIDFNKLMLVQGEAQAAHNQALGFTLRDHGILCVPNGKSITAVGYTAHPQGAAKMRAAGAGAANVGPGAAAAAAQGIAAQTTKRVVPWREALANLKGTVNTAATRAVSGFLVKVDETIQVRMATGAVKGAFAMHAASGALRYAEGSVKATAAQLCTPHVRPEVLDWVWGRTTADPRGLGAKEVALHPDGTRMFAPAAGDKVERQIGEALVRAGKAAVPGLSKREVVGTLVPQGLTTDERRDLYELCAGGGLRWASQSETGTIGRAVEAYERAGRGVYVVGDPAVAAKLGRAGWSARGFVDSATRTGHLRSLWLGLRQKGPFGDWLGAAEHIRAAKPRVQVNAGDLVVLAPKDPRDAGAVKAVVELATEKGAKILMAGPAAEQYRALWQAEVKKQSPTRGVHL